MELVELGTVDRKVIDDGWLTFDKGSTAMDEEPGRVLSLGAELNDKMRKNFTPNVEKL